MALAEILYTEVRPALAMGQYQPRSSQTEGEQCPECEPAGRPNGQPDSVRPHQVQGLPAGLRLVCLLLGLFGPALVYVGLQLRKVPETVAEYPQWSGPSRALVELGEYAPLFIALGLFQVVAAYGLWKRTSWGWVAGVCAPVSGVLLNLLVLSIFSEIGGVAPWGLIFYLGLALYVYTQRWRYDDSPRPAAQPSRTRPDQAHQRQ